MCVYRRARDRKGKKERKEGKKKECACVREIEKERQINRGR